MCIRDRSKTDRNNVFWKLSAERGDALYSVRLSHYDADYKAAGYLSLPAMENGLDPRSTQFNNPGFGDARRNSLVFNRSPARGGEGWSVTGYVETLERTRGIATSATQHTVGYDDRDILGGRVARNLRFGEQASLTLGADLRRDKGDASRRIYLNGVPTANSVSYTHLTLPTKA